MSPAQLSTGRHSEPKIECQAVHALIDCVAPLVRDLRERGLVSSYFYVNHWAQSHIRLRFKPTSPDHLDEVCRAADAAMSRFLAKREPDPGEPEDCLAVDHLVLLYADEERRWISESAPSRVRFVRYEPEYGRYGGPAGVDLAEWHFECSSDLVLDLAQSVDAHTRLTMLGLCAQLIMIMSAAFLPDTDELAGYLADLGADHPDAAEPGWEGVVPVLRTRFAEVRAAMAAHDQEPAVARPADPGGDWLRHCHELRERTLELGRAGALMFPQPPDSEADLLVRLLTPYLQATNNRLGASPADQAYVAHLLAMALRP